MPREDELLAAAKEVLESGDTTGCDGDVIVIGLSDYQRLQAAVLALTGVEYGESVDESDEEEEEDGEE